MNLIGLIIHILIVATVIFLVIKLINKIGYKRLSITFLISFLLTMLIPCFESMQKFSPEKAELVLGFPFDFYTIKYTALKTFAVHFNIIGFLANIVVTYFVLSFFVWGWKKIRGEQK